MNLIDPQGRIIDYLRVSVTDRCNLSCIYCRPGSAPFLDGKELLTDEEIVSFCREAAALGIRHIRITGGEPLLRKGCCDLIAELKGIPGIETVTLTTNGTLLHRFLHPLLRAGIDGINVSLDTLDKKRYQTITGSDLLDQVTEAVREASGLGIPVKINCVTLEDSTKDVPQAMGFFQLAELARSLAVDVRFIEAMPIGITPEGFEQISLDHRKLIEEFLVRYPGMSRTEKVRGFGPAIYYQVPGFTGRIGFISALHHQFCNRCNRIRLTSQGVLKGCLGFEGTIRLKPLFNAEEPQKALHDAILKVVREKPPCHRFGCQNPMAERESMSKIGG